MIRHQKSTPLWARRVRYIRELYGDTIHGPMWDSLWRVRIQLQTMANLVYDHMIQPRR